MKKIMACLILALMLAIAPTSSLHAAENGEIVFQPDLYALQAGETLADVLEVEGEGFFADGTGGLVSANNTEYNAIYFSTSLRQFHFSALMTPVNPGTSITGGLSFKTLAFDGRRMDLAVTTGTFDKSILIYAYGILLADNRNTNQGGLGGLNAFNTTDPIRIDLFGDRNYYAVFINETLVIETILPLEGTGVFGIRSQMSLVRYSDIVIRRLGDTLLNNYERYYEETFETITLQLSKSSASVGESVTFEAILDPSGKSYDDVRWTINGNPLFNVTSLEVTHVFQEPGTYEIEVVVDRQRASQTLVVSSHVDGNGATLGVTFYVMIGLLVVAVGMVGLLMFYKIYKKKDASV